MNTKLKKDDHGQVVFSNFTNSLDDQAHDALFSIMTDVFKITGIEYSQISDEIYGEYRSVIEAFKAVAVKIAIESAMLNNSKTK